MARSDEPKPSAERREAQAGEGEAREAGKEWLVGIFVGGRSSRMGTPKGLLRAPSDGVTPDGLNLLERTSWVAASAFPEAPQVLVGVRPEYARFGLPAVADSQPDKGPLAGLVALLGEAERRGLAGALALGCDFPYLSADLLERFLRDPTPALVLAPHTGGYYQPLVARYRVGALAPCVRALAEDRRSLQALLAELGAARLPLEPGDDGALRDWDAPEDLKYS